MITVVCALIFDDVTGEVLMTLRRPDAKRPHLWELPGGKVDDGDASNLGAWPGELGEAVIQLKATETPDKTLMAALQREIREELGVRVHVGPLVAGTSFRWKEPVSLSLFHCLIAPNEGKPKPLAASDLKYVVMEEAIDYLPMVPSTYLFYKLIVSYIRGHVELMKHAHTLVRGY